MRACGRRRSAAYEEKRNDPEIGRGVRHCDGCRGPSCIFHQTDEGWTAEQKYNAQQLETQHHLLPRVDKLALNTVSTARRASKVGGTNLGSDVIRHCPPFDRRSVN